jgi:hypothetical protein
MKIIERINQLKAELKELEPALMGLVNPELTLQEHRKVTKQAAELRARLLSAYDVFFLYTVAWDNKKLTKKGKNT